MVVTLNLVFFFCPIYSPCCSYLHHHAAPVKFLLLFRGLAQFLVWGSLLQFQHKNNIFLCLVQPKPSSQINATLNFGANFAVAYTCQVYTVLTKSTNCTCVPCFAPLLLRYVGPGWHTLVVIYTAVVPLLTLVRFYPSQVTHVVPRYYPGSPGAYKGQA